MSKRYFINNHDSVIGQEILKELTKEETDDPIHMVTYLDHNMRDRPKGVKKVLNRHSKPKLMRKKMLEECDVYIYDLHFGDLDDVLFGGNILDKATLEEQKVLIIISDVMVWNQTPKKIKEKVAAIPEEGENGEENNQQQQDQDEENAEENEKSEGSSPEDGQFEGEDQKDQKQEDEVQQEEEAEEPVEYTSYQEKDYKSRNCSEAYAKMKRMESLMLKLNKENLKVIVVCSGILYGLGELAFRNHFQAAWLQNPPALPYLGTGENLIPTIHISDLAKFVIKVSENPPENNYLFAIDNTKDRRQSAIIQSIADGVGSRKIESVEQTELIDSNTYDIFTLDIDLQPSPLLVGDEENPVDFEWKCEKGLTDPANNFKVLQEFQKQHKLRPIKIVMFTPEQERSEKESKFDWSTQEISQHYRIPIIKIKEVLLHLKENMKNDILGDDLREEYDKIISYLDEKKPRKLDETLKVLYRVIRWRLSQNDCLNRGYILDNYPIFGSECDHIFFPQKKKLDRVRPKPKKVKKVKKVKKSENEDEEQNAQKAEVKEKKKKRKQEEDGEEEENDNEEDEENEEEEDNEEEAANEGNKEGQEAEEEQEEEEEEEEEPKEDEEEQPQEEEENEEEEDPDNPKPKIEPYYPESIIFIKKMTQERDTQLNNSACEIIDYFSQKNIEAYIVDTTKKDEFEIFESQRIYIEREGRPFNYLVHETELEKKHKEFYKTVNDSKEQAKKQKKEEEEKEILAQKQHREDVAKKQIDFIHKSELEIDQIKNLPFRNYLMEYIVPELNEGLLEVSNMLPDDPVEFLAEYLYSQSYE